jgi:hypothetical protein
MTVIWEAGMYLKVKRVVGAIVAIVFVAAWFAYGSLENTYVNYPRSPDVREGRTVSYNVKGIIVYITRGQNNFLSWLIWTEIGSGLIAGIVILIHQGDPFKSKK